MLLLAYCLFIKNAVSLLVWQVLNFFDTRPINILRNLLLVLLSIIVIAFLHIHWVFFVIDECLFFLYRKTKIKRPLFIVGVPRSGTTYLQRTIASDTHFTSTTLFECLFTPSISQRYIAKGFYLALKPLINMFKKSNKRLIPSFFKNMQDIHALGLNEPEEDFFMLMPILSCFIQMTIFPHYPRNWKLAQFDHKINDFEKKIIMNFYRLMVKKHVFFHNNQTNSELTYLAKNPSFTSWIESLHEYFEDANIIVCVRDPKNTFPSQISSLAPIFNITGHDLTNKTFTNNIHNMLTGYYQHIEALSSHEVTNKTKSLIHIVDIDEIKKQLLTCLQSIYTIGNYPLSDSQLLKYQQESEKNKQFKSKHQYNLKAKDAENSSENIYSHIWPLPTQSRLIN